MIFLLKDGFKWNSQLTKRNYERRSVDIVYTLYDAYHSFAPHKTQTIIDDTNLVTHSIVNTR